MTISIPSPAKLSIAAKEFVAAMEGHKVFAFVAPMGAGKTTFIRSVCEALGVTDTVNSPTFSIVNEYRCADSLDSVFHFDFYRLKNTAEASNMGLEEYFYSGSPCFVEWPEVAEALLPDDTVYIYIHVEPDGTRIVSTTQST